MVGGSGLGGWLRNGEKRGERVPNQGRAVETGPRWHWCEGIARLADTSLLLFGILGILILICAAWQALHAGRKSAQN